MTHRITIERNTLRFAAAHFTTSGDACEPLHGHNYDVFVEIEGELSKDGWVLDFVETKRLVRGICEELDHRFLLALGSPALNTRETPDAYEITHRTRRYVIPKEDVMALPVDNTTAERISEWIANRIILTLRSRGASNVRTVTVGVEEAPGQAGWFTARLNQAD